MPRFNPYENIPPWDYPELRQLLARPYQNLLAPQIEALFESYDLSAENMEVSLQDIGKVVSTAAPIVGTLIGGPPGALIGVEAGKIAGKAISQAGDRSPRAKKLTASSVQAKAPGLTDDGSTQPSPQVPQTPPGGSPTAGKIMKLLLNPKVLESFERMFLGQLAGSDVKIDKTSVPEDAFINLLKVMLEKLQSEQRAAKPTKEEGMPEYLQDYAGEVTVDPAVAEHRAEVLYEMLIESENEPERFQRLSYEDAEAEAYYAEMELAEYYNWEDSEAEAFYDELEQAEYYDYENAW